MLSLLGEISFSRHHWESSILGFNWPSLQWFICMQSVTASSLFGRGQCIPLFWFFSILYLSLLINLMVVSYFLISFLLPTNFVKCITPLRHREETKWIWWSYSPCVIMSDSPSFLGVGVNWWIKFYLLTSGVIFDTLSLGLRSCALRQVSFGIFLHRVCLMKDLL